MLQRVASKKSEPPLQKVNHLTKKKWTSLDSTRQKRNQFTLDFTKPKFRPMLQRVFSIQLIENGFFLKKKTEVNW